MIGIRNAPLLQVWFDYEHKIKRPGSRTKTHDASLSFSFPSPAAMPFDPADPTTIPLILIEVTGRLAVAVY